MVKAYGPKRGKGGRCRAKTGGEDVSLERRGPIRGWTAAFTWQMVGRGPHGKLEVENPRGQGAGQVAEVTRLMVGGGLEGAKGRQRWPYGAGVGN